MNGRRDKDTEIGIINKGVGRMCIRSKRHATYIIIKERKEIEREKGYEHKIDQ